MKTRIFLTIVTLAVFAVVSDFWSAVESPVRGALTAAQLNDNTSSYVWARFVQHNGIEDICFFTALITLTIIWLFPTKK